VKRQHVERRRRQVESEKNSTNWQWDRLKIARAIIYVVGNKGDMLLEKFGYLRGTVVHKIV
jgi:hypothetical protein